MIAAEPELKALMLAALDGDAKAYRTLLAALTGYLRAYYLKRAGEEAEDLVQETLIAIHSKRSTYDPAQPFTAWVYAVARHKMIDAWRKKKRRMSVSLEDAGELFAEDEAEAAIAQRDVSLLLATLPAARRKLIERVKLEGQSVADVAAESGLSESAVKVGIHRGLKSLAERIKGRSGA